MAGGHGGIDVDAVDQSFDRLRALRPLTVTIVVLVTMLGWFMVVSRPKAGHP